MAHSQITVFLLLDVLLYEPIPLGQFSAELYDPRIGLAQQICQVVVAILQHFHLRLDDGYLIVALLQTNMQFVHLLTRVLPVLFNLRL